MEELGPRVGYIEKSYHFIDNLTAHAAFMTLEDASHFEQTLLGISELGKEFEVFLEKDVNQAFEINFDFTKKEEPKFSINDLQIDTEELKNKWKKFSDETRLILSSV